MRFATKAIRVGQDPDRAHRAVIAPIYQSATFAWEDLDSPPAIDYGRCMTPNRQALEAALCALENAEHCTMFASGMAAIMAAFSLVSSGEEILCARDIYGGTFRLCKDVLPYQGISTTHFDASDPDSIRGLCKPNTRLLIYESPSNPTLKVFDVPRIAEIGRELGLIVVFDNTFASPALMNPLDYGVDVVVHSTTKYISGHSDVVGGALLTNRADLAEKIVFYSKCTGAVPSPFDNWLTLRGLKTLELRMKRHCDNALAVAEFLATHPKVRAVHYPGLADDPGRALAQRMMRGFGGMLSFEVEGSTADVAAIANAFRVFLLAESLGGVESLVAYPKIMSHASLTDEERAERGITDNLLRLSVGIEDPNDLIEDLDQALRRVASPARARA